MNILELSISVSGLIIWVLFVRLLGKKYLNKRVIVVLWNLVILRALIPIQIPIEKLPFLNAEKTFNLYPEVFSISQKIASSNQLFIEQKTLPYSGGIEKCILAIWLVGAVATGLIVIRRSILEIQLMRKIMPVEYELVEKLIHNSGIHRKIRVYTGRGFQSPVTCGMIWPKIILPEDFGKQPEIHRRNMIFHELEHIRRFDVCKRICMTLAVCIHWFNPLVWISARLYREDQEMACDERVLCAINHKEAKEYADTLISMSAKKEKEAVLFEGFQKKNVERERILAVIENRKMGAAGMIAAIVLTASSIVSFAYYAPKLPPAQNATGKRQEKESGTDDSDTTAVQSRDAWMAEIEHYRLIWEDIIQNHNDPDEPFTAEQNEAYDYYVRMKLADTHLKSLEEGKALNKENMELIEEIYPDRNYMKKN